MPFTYLSRWKIKTEKRRAAGTKQAKGVFYVKFICTEANHTMIPTIVQVHEKRREIMVRDL